jgi:hypothetical protein
VLVRPGELLQIERGLAGTGQTDQDYALHVCVATG